MIKLKGAFLALSLMAVGAIFSGNVLAECEPGEERETNTGAVFTCDDSYPDLGEAWRDPDGLIWGDIVKNEDGSVQQMVQSSRYMGKIGRPLPKGELGAKEYCESIDARLPSKEDFTRLREYMGAQSGTQYGYLTQVLPNLVHFFWSSSVHPSDDTRAHDFGGHDGHIGNNFRIDSLAVRCVVSR